MSSNYSSPRTKFDITDYSDCEQMKDFALDVVYSCCQRKESVLLGLFASAFGLDVSKKSNLKKQNGYQKYVLNAVKNPLGSRIYEVNDWKYTIAQDECPREFDVTTAGNVSITGAVDQTIVIPLASTINAPLNDANYVVPTVTLHYINSSNPAEVLSTQLIVVSVDIVAGTVTVVANYSGQLGDPVIMTIPSGSKLKIGLNSLPYSSTSCDITDCLNSVAKPCCRDGYLQLFSGCYEISKQVLHKTIKTYSLFGDQIERAKKAAMDNLLNMVNNTLYHGKPAVYATAGSQSYHTAGLEYFISQADIVNVSDCCLPALEEAFRGIVTDRVSLTGDNPSNTLIVLTSRKVRQTLTAHYNRYATTFRNLSEVAAANPSIASLAKSLSAMELFTYNVQGVTFVFIEDDTFGQMYPGSMAVIDFDKFAIFTMAVSKATVNGQTSYMGGFMRDLEINDPKSYAISNCAIKFAYEGNFAMEMLCPMTLINMVECDPCTGTIVSGPATTGGVQLPGRTASGHAAVSVAGKPTSGGVILP